MKTAATATLNYGNNGGSAAAQTAWANNFSANIDAILSAAIKAVPQWQAAVATQQAATNMQAGLTKAKGNEAAIISKVQGVGKASFSAGVRAAALPGGDYTTFAGAWMPAVTQERATLDISNPRGDDAANTARMLAYNSWAISKRGQYRVK
jgi:hypothetical protein